MNQLPRTFKDAIAITKELGYRYLWIDSLCIVQDSVEDWTQESGYMAQIYGNAMLNLAACGSSSDAGCFEVRDPRGHLACKLFGRNCNLYVAPSFAPFPAHLPLFTRSWIIQERLLSRRNVYFGMGELYWECFDGVKAETWPEGVSPDDEGVTGRRLYSVQDKTLFGRLFEVLQCLKYNQAYKEQDSFVEFVRLWSWLASTYSATKLTFVNDKIATMSGIVSIIAQRTSFEYIAGMWMPSLPATLLWQRSRNNSSPMVQTRWKGTPSWSWASIEGAIWMTRDFDDLEQKIRWDNTFRRGDSRFCAEILGYQIKQLEDRPRVFGEVDEARLHMIGLLRHIPEWVINDESSRGKCGPGICTTSHAIFPEIETPIDIFPDIEICEGAALSFFTLFRDSYKDWVREEGLVLTPHLDGFVRVGKMDIRHPKNGKERLSTVDLLWGSGRKEAIFIY